MRVACGTQQPVEVMQELWDVVRSAENAQSKLRGALAPVAAADVHSMHGPGSDGSCQARLLGNAVDSVMRSTEEALLVTGMLLRHAADMLAFVHRVQVPIHSSLHHKIGGKTQAPEQVRLDAVAACGAPYDTRRLIGLAAHASCCGRCVQRWGVPPSPVEQQRYQHHPCMFSNREPVCQPPGS